MSQASLVVIITGAANGIGRATAPTFGGAGDHVVGWDLDDDDGAAWVDRRRLDWRSPGYCSGLRFSGR